MYIRDVLQGAAEAAERVLGPVEEKKDLGAEADLAVKLCPFQALPGFLPRRDQVQPYPEYKSSMNHAQRATFPPRPSDDKQARAAFLFTDGAGNYYPHRPAVVNATDIQFMEEAKKKQLRLVPRKLRRELGRMERKRYAAIVAKRAKSGYPSQEASGVERGQDVEQVGDRG